MAKAANAGQEFGFIRSKLWPIYQSEFKRFILMALIMTCMLFNYSILRNTKDTLLVPIVGAEVLGTTKLFAVMPAAIIFMIVYAKLTNILSRKALFCTIVGTFLGFFMLFGFVIFPQAEALQIDMTDFIVNYPSLKWPALLVQHWAPVTFYVSAELWGTVCVSLLFWQFANATTNVTESKRFYAGFGMLANVGLILSGLIAKMFGAGASFGEEGGGMDKAALQALSRDTLIGTVRNTMLAVLIAGIVLIIAYLLVSKLVDTANVSPDGAAKPKKPKVQLSLSDSFKHIFSSKYLGYIALLVLCYGISMNLIEVVWKNSIKSIYADANEYYLFMANFQIYLGMASIIMMILGSNFLRFFGWTTTALMTPGVNMFTGAVFFGFIICKDWFSASIVGIAAIVIGTIQNVFAKSTKYALFDPTKEMAYIPLDDDLKTKGKAAVEVVGGRAGKAGGSLIQFVLLLWPGTTIADWTNVLSVLFMITIVIWMIAVVALGKLFNTITTAEQTQ